MAKNTPSVKHIQLGMHVQAFRRNTSNHVIGYVASCEFSPTGYLQVGIAATPNGVPYTFVFPHLLRSA